jgi:hypothetical protein
LQVGARGLAGVLVVGGDVEDVVGQLEGHPDVPAVGGGCLDADLVDPGQQRAVAAGGLDQRRGLAGDHLEVVVEGR